MDQLGVDPWVQPALSNANEAVGAIKKAFRRLEIRAVGLFRLAGLGTDYLYQARQRFQILHSDLWEKAPYLFKLHHEYGKDVKASLGYQKCHQPGLHTRWIAICSGNCNAETLAPFESTRISLRGPLAVQAESLLTREVLPLLAASRRVIDEIDKERRLIYNYYTILHDPRRGMGPVVAVVDKIMCWLTGGDPEGYLPEEARGEAKEPRFRDGERMVRHWIEKSTIEQQGGYRWEILVEEDRLSELAEQLELTARLAELNEKLGPLQLQGDSSAPNGAHQRGLTYRRARRTNGQAQ